MIGRRFLAILIPLGLPIAAIFSLTSRAHPGGVGVSLPPHPAALQGVQAVTTPFKVYRVPPEVSALANRDLEFLTSRTYENYNRALDAKYNGSDRSELDKLGITICDDPGTNPFGFQITDIRLAYDYFARRATAAGNFRDSLYNQLASAPIGFKVWEPSWPDSDRQHIDTYVYLPKFDNDGAFGSYAGDSGRTAFGQTPSFFFSPGEDSTTGKIGIYEEWHRNSLQVPGPKPSEVGDPSPATHWARANALQSWGFNHEFTHSINYNAPAQAGTALSELFSSAAEAIAGELPEPPRFEVPYSWSLMRSLVGAGGNYQAWRGFSAYLAFQFRGVDTTASGRHDDLFWRWAGKEPEQTTFFRLADRLSAAECAECTLRTYLQGKSPTDRRELVIHNWRVAMFANRHGLAENQYGFVPHLGFDPARDLGTWRGFLAGTEADDSVSVPHEFVLLPEHRTREASLAGSQADVGGALTYRSTTLEPYGADYWVLRPDAALGTARRTLVVKIRPEIPCYLPNRRLMASLILYREHSIAGGQPDSLWKHPEWVRGVQGPVWADMGNGQGELPEIVVSDFGDSTKAVVVVLSLGDDGPSSGGSAAVVRYRLNFGFRSSPYLSTNPTPIGAEAGQNDHPTFSPAGDSLAFTYFDPEIEASMVMWRSLGTGPPTLMVQPPIANHARPDWSPRGDWVAFDREVTPGQNDIWAYSTRGLGLRRLTTSTSDEIGPAFNPNGQRLVYLRATGSGGRELRVVGLDGSGDSLLLTRTDGHVLSPRWAPDGRHVYFAASDTLYSVSLLGRTVSGHRYLGPDTRSFDLPLGKERIAVQRKWTEARCAAISPPAPASEIAYPQRTVLLDTLSGKEEMMFARPRIQVMTPRWSASGSRLAFASNPLPGDSCELFVGQARYNQPPVLHDVAAFHFLDIYAHIPFSWDFHTTDSDGETVSFAAAYLPDSATFQPDSGIFRWPNPKKAGADSLFYIVFRALDPSGGVHSYVTCFRVKPVAPSGGGCPFADVRTADGWVTENSILGRSPNGEPGLDACRLQQSPEVGDGRLRLRLRENEREITTLDQLRLVTVDRSAALAAVAGEGEIHTGVRMPAYRIATPAGIDVTALVNGGGWLGAPGDTLLVEFDPPGRSGFGLTGTLDGGVGGGDGLGKEDYLRYDPGGSGGPSALEPRATPASMTDAEVLEGTGIVIQAPDDNGGWQEVSHWYPRAHGDARVFPALTHPRARLIFVGSHRLTWFGRLKPAVGTATQTVLEPLVATHSRLGDVKGEVEAGGGSTLLAPGDTVTAEFAVPPAVEGLVRDYFLVTRGVYTSMVGTARLAPGSPSLPLRHALLPNVPNPFSAVTTIRFELPRAERVRLEVFDLSGRRVRTLADGEWPAGTHALDWDRSGNDGRRLGAGVYLYRLTAGGFRAHRKMVIGAR